MLCFFALLRALISDFARYSFFLCKPVLWWGARCITVRQVGLSAWLGVKGQENMYAVEKELHLETWVLRALPAALLSFVMGTVNAKYQPLGRNSLWQNSSLFLLLRSRWQRGSPHYQADLGILCLCRLKNCFNPGSHCSFQSYRYLNWLRKTQKLFWG